MKKKYLLLIILVPIFIVSMVFMFIFLSVKENEKRDKIDKKYFENTSIFLKGSVYDYRYKGRCSMLYINVDTISYKHLQSDYFIGVYDTIERKAIVLARFYYPGLVDWKKVPKDSLPQIEINYKKNEIIYSSANYNDTVPMDLLYLELNELKGYKCYNCIAF